MDKFPVLTTDRIRLRKLLAKDIPNIVEYANNPKIAEMTLNIPHPYHEKDAISWINMANQGFEDKSKYIFAISLLTTDQFIGGTGLKINKRFDRAELGYWIAEPFWNNGYATEAVREVLTFGFEEAGLNKIIAHHMVKNPASGNVMIKNGMLKESTLIEHIKKDGQYLDVVQYRLTQKEFADNQ